MKKIREFFIKIYIRLNIKRIFGNMFFGRWFENDYKPESINDVQQYIDGCDIQKEFVEHDDNIIETFKRLAH